ncbi:MAG: carbohydrate-binding domain-containing protein, partial [Clostridiaceae bacterium]|nr:carbohydrate-binding domain-containing protein [Clostridiaceae bacterium]
MRKRFLSLLLVLCMIISLLPTTILAVPDPSGPELYVGGTDVTQNTDVISYWKTDGDGYSRTGDESDYYFSVSYNSDTESFTIAFNWIPTITSFHQEEVSGETINYGIFCTTALNIHMNDYSSCTFFLADESHPTYGIYSSDVLTIKGSGQLNVYGSDSNPQIGAGICGVNGVTIEGGIIYASDFSYGIAANNGPITVSGGEVFGSGAVSGFFAENSGIMISGGIVVARGFASGEYVGYGLTANDSGITISEGWVKAYGGYQALNTTGPVSITAHPYMYRTSTEPGDPDPDSAYIKSLNDVFADSNTFRYVEFCSCNIFVGGQDVSGSADAATYWLNDGNGGITDAGADSDHYNVKYDGSTNTLTLYNADLTEVYTGTITAGDEWPISAPVFTMWDLNIVLEGENRIAPSSGAGIASALGLDFSGDGSLSIEVDETGIYAADGDMNFHNGNISVEGYHSIIVNNGNINILGGNISAKGEVVGIESAYGNINIYGGMVEAISLEDGFCNALEAYERNVNIYGGTVITRAAGSWYCYGIYAGDNVEILGGAVYANGGTSSVFSYDGISPSASYSKYTVIMTEDSAGTYTPTVLYNHDAALVDVDASLWVGGFPFVYDEHDIWTTESDKVYGNSNANDHNYTWSVKYRPEDETFDLTLNGNNIASYSDGDKAISANCGLDLMLESKSIIGTNFDPPSKGIFCEGGMTISAENGGSVTAFGTEQALYAGPEGESITVNIPAYRHRTNIVAAVPATSFSYYPDTAFDVSNAASYKYVNIAAPIPVTFNSNSVVHDTKTVYTGESIGSTAWPANPTQSGYAFGGWFTGENGTGTEFTSATQVDFSMTVYAKWTYSVVGGGVSDSTSPPPQKNITVTETSSKVFENTPGTITAEANMDNAFANSVEVKVTDTSEDAANFKLSAGDEVYPFDISLYIKGTNTRTEPAPGYAVTIILPIPENLLDKKELLDVMHKSDDGRVTTLNSRLVQKDGVWYLVFEATEFSPYALVVRNLGTYDESTGVPYYLDTKGNKVFIGFAANGKYIAPEGVTVSLMQNDKNFIDVTGHWAASNIDFTTERELFFGTGNNKFSPDIGMTRAMFATVIGRLYERSFGEITTLSTHSFVDCDHDSYYGKYIDW